MSKNHYPLLAGAVVALAFALAGCAEVTPAGGGLGAAPDAAPPAVEPGLRTETLIVAIVADEAGDAGLAQRVTATQTNVTAATTLRFPSDFGAPVRHRSGPFSFEYDFHKTLPNAGITQTVIDRGGIIPWASVNGGARWHAGGFDLGGQVKLRFEYRAGDAEDASGSVTITLAAHGISPTDHTELGAAHATDNIRSYLTSNSLLIRFFIVTS